MTDYRFLTAADFEALHRCYLEAFSDYTVDMRVSAKEFEQILIHNGVRFELSVGAFDAGEMIAFTMNAYDSWQGQPTAYDSGTGVVPQHRRKGISNELFDWMLPILKENDISQYLLEVISTNEPALNLYQKLGFRKTRELAAFILNAPPKPAENESGDAIQIRAVDSPDWRLLQSFWNGYPSWQSSIESIKRSVTERAFLGAYLQDNCIGYGVVSQKGRVLQLAVAPDHRRKGIGSIILAALQSNVAEGTPLKFVNIDRSLKGMLAFCEATGFEWMLDQYEMIKQL